MPYEKSMLRRFAIAALPVVALAASGVAIVGPAAAQDSLRMLAGLQKGSWEVRFRDGSQPRRVCVRAGTELIQLRHSGNCNRYVVEDGAQEVTVQYTCRGNGYGRTNVRQETKALVQIESQGIADGQPFQFTAEARRVAACG